MMLIEKYNRFGKIIEVYPTFDMACHCNHISPLDMARRLTYWNDSSHEQYKWARVEDCAQAEQFPIVQYKNRQPINRFTTLQEAASAMGYSISQIDRWIKRGEIDAWGCTWSRTKTIKSNKA